MRTVECCILALSLSSQTLVSQALTNPDEFKNCNLNRLSETETVLIADSALNIKGRVDTGAKQSSLHALDVKVIEENNEQYVQFHSLDDSGQFHDMKEKVEYVTQITNTSGVPERRYVIKTRVTIKNKEYIVNVNLKDRSRMHYKFLIGRDLLKQGGYTVDVGAS